MKRSSADAILDATQDVVLAIGVKRATFADVARAAGLSRATLYTHFSDVDAAVVALLTRELGLVLGAAHAAAGEGDARSRLIAIVRRVLETLPHHPLFENVVRVDPEVLLPYLVRRFGAVQHAARQVLDSLVIAGQGDGSIRDGDPVMLSHMVLLTVQSFVVSQRLTGATVDAGALIDAVAGMLDAGLAP